jgi:hypothetical protein
MNICFIDVSIHRLFWEEKKSEQVDLKKEKNKSTICA